MKKHNSAKTEEPKNKNGEYTTINNMINKEQALVNIINKSTIAKTVKIFESTTIPIKSYIKNMNNFYNSLHKNLNKFVDIIKPITETVINLKINITPYFKELEKALQKAKENPDSLINWIDYCKKLKEYIWVVPFDIKSEELKDILEIVNSEKEFDKYMIKYFNNSKITKLCDNILLMLPYKHKVIFRQITKSFFNKNYALCNLGITAIIDDLCTFFLKDKGCLKRKNLFLPIIEDVENTSNNNFEVIPLIIVNSHINTIYENVDFRKRISIPTHKKTRRSANQHGKKFVNNKLDVIMLFNTIYYILIVINDFNKYKGKIIYVDNRRKMEMVNTFTRVQIPGFYIKKKYYRTKNNNK